MARGRARRGAWGEGRGDVKARPLVTEGGDISVTRKSWRDSLPEIAVAAIQQHTLDLERDPNARACFSSSRRVFPQLLPPPSFRPSSVVLRPSTLPSFSSSIISSFARPLLLPKGLRGAGESSADTHVPTLFLPLSLAPCPSVRPSVCARLSLSLSLSLSHFLSVCVRARVIHQPRTWVDRAFGWKFDSTLRSGLAHTVRRVP
jgi:hypothetical protein